MRSTWTKPELYVENYELTQVVAAGCGVSVEIPGEDSTIIMGCNQENGGGHWSWSGTYGELLAEGDANGDGNIDWNEFTDVVGAAKNGQQTGPGHENHGIKVVVDGTKYEDVPFNS